MPKVDAYGLQLAFAPFCPCPQSARRGAREGGGSECTWRPTGDRWTVAKLAHVANLSPFHLCHVFRQLVGTSLYNYVLHERLAQTIDVVLNGSDLTAIALDVGFASHSHFTAHFRRFFGFTPTMLRRARSGIAAAQSRKIVTARRRHPA